MIRNKQIIYDGILFILKELNIIRKAISIIRTNAVELKDFNILLYSLCFLNTLNSLDASGLYKNSREKVVNKNPIIIPKKLEAKR